MTAYHQMGHDSENLLLDENLLGYAGAILSPVNYPQSKIASQIAAVANRERFEMIFDPQLYVPTSDRGRLREWSYFPSDVDTADLSSDAWWEGVVTSLSDCCSEFMPSGVCSPTVLPRTYSNDFYSQMVRVGNRFADVLQPQGIECLQSAVINLTDLPEAGRSETIASILSQSVADRTYLVIVGSVDPRRELSDVEELKSAMRLIRLLEDSGMKVLVSHSSSDVLLWKAAGATSCATGKFFNLRRFTRSRFEEPTSGGGQLPYWFEENYLAFLRESDLIRLTKSGTLSDASLSNPFAGPIAKQVAEGGPWLALAWRQFLYWFADAEHRVSDGALDVAQLLHEAERRWLDLEDKSILMEEPRNDGSWIRPWRRAVAEFKN